MGISAHVARRNAQRTAERDGEMREIAADASPLGGRIEGRGHLVRNAADVVDIVVDPVADRIDAPVALRLVAERALGETLQLVGLAVAAGPQMHQNRKRQVARRHLGDGFGRLEHGIERHLGFVFELERAGLDHRPEIAVAAFRHRPALGFEVRRERQGLAPNPLTCMAHGLDIEHERRPDLDPIGKAAADRKIHSRLPPRGPRELPASLHHRAESRPSPPAKAEHAGLTIC